MNNFSFASSYQQISRDCMINFSPNTSMTGLFVGHLAHTILIRHNSRQCENMDAQMAACEGVGDTEAGCEE